MSLDLRSSITDWLSRAAKTEVPEQVVALNMGLFETEQSYGLYLACCDEFDEEDSDWASSECYDHPLRYLEIPNLKAAYPDWSDFQDALVAAAKQLVTADSFTGTWLSSLKGITVGFDEGALVRIL